MFISGCLYGCRIRPLKERCPPDEDAPGRFGRGHTNSAESVILALTSCLRLFLASDGRLLIMLSLANLLLDTGLRTASLEAAQRTVQRLVFTNNYV